MHDTVLILFKCTKHVYLVHKKSVPKRKPNDSGMKLYMRVCITMSCVNH